MPQDQNDDEIWVFGYGSLMWRPGFPYKEAHAALLRGYHRALCVYSHHYRGTVETPGLVFGLDQGGSCRGRAFLLASDDVPEVMEYLHEREMISNTYIPKFIPVRLDDGRLVNAYNFVVRRDTNQYTGKISQEQAAMYVRQGHGDKGSSFEYLENTIIHLDELGIVEGPLHRIYELAKKRTS